MRGAGSPARSRRSRIAVIVVPAVLLGACATPERDVPRNTLGMRVGGGLFDATSFDAAEVWLGVPITHTVQFTGRKSQRDMNGSAFGLLAADTAALPGYADRLELSITIPLGFGTDNAQTREGRERVRSNLMAAAAGEFDDAYRRVADRLVTAGFEDAVIRLGHEFNGAWSPWSSRTNEDAFIAAWRHVHGVLREVSAAFLFDWTATRPAWFEWGPPAYPGDDYVDIVGMDVYWRADQRGRWDSNLWERGYLRVMRDHLDFAVQHGKQVSYPEWGLAGLDNPRFVEAMHEWLAGLPLSGPGSLRYHSYFNTTDEFSLDAAPATRAAFAELFGAG